jgi:hypothetical protein
MSNDRYYVPCTVTGNALAEAKNEKRTPSVKIAMRSHPQQEGEQSRALYSDLWLTEAAFEGTIKTLEEVFGWTGHSLAELNEPVLAGVEVVAVCEQEYNDQLGKWFEKVVFINRPGGGGGVARMDEAQTRQVVGKLDALLNRHRQNKPAATRTAATTPVRRAATAQGATAQAATAGDAGFFGNEPPTRQRQSGNPADYGIPADKDAF